MGEMGKVEILAIAALMVALVGAIAITMGSDTPAVMATDEVQIIHMNVTYGGFVPNHFNLKKGVPVNWEINGQQLSGCNNQIVVPAYGLNFKVSNGVQTIKFIPSESGEVDWSCWMGMFKGKFIVE